MGNYCTVISSDGRYYDFFYDKLVEKINRDCIYIYGNAKIHQLRVKANYNQESSIHVVDFRIGEVIE